MELLIVLGMLGIVYVVVIVAINPSKHLCETRNAERTINSRTYEKAMQTYEIETFKKAGGDSVPVGKGNAKPICRHGVTDDPTCVNLDVLVPEAVVGLPIDPAELNVNYTGFSIYRTVDGIEYVGSLHEGEC